MVMRSTKSHKPKWKQFLKYNKSQKNGQVSKGATYLKTIKVLLCVSVCK
jgi:hypothetical protein